jgi:hypothetical protein
MLKNNANRLNDYTKDQVNLLANKYFKVDIYEQKDFYDYKLFGIIYLIILILLLSMNLIKTDNCIINVIKKIGSYLFYITFCTFSHLFLLIFNRGIFIKFSNSYYEIEYDFIFDVVLFLLYNILHYLFYNIFIYAYGQNETYYFLTSKIFIATFSLNELGIFLFIIRLHIKYSILFQLIWSVIYIYEYFVRIQVYRDSLHQSTFQKISFFLQTFVFSIFIVRFVTLFLIKYLKYEKTFKILEGILIILLIFVTFFYLSKSRQYVNLTKLLNDLKNGECEFFEGGYQLFIPLRKFFLSKTHTNRVLEKNK